MAQSKAGSHWKERMPPERAYKRRARASTPTVEQDRAAGGRDRREVSLDDGGFARASITLRLYRRTRRIRAYLRWSQGGRTREKYVCEVEHDTRGKNLSAAWRQARLQGLVSERVLPPGSTASSLNARSSMRGNRGRDTKPELLLRSALHRRGMRYRVSARPVPGLRRTADLVFVRARVAVFVDGCYWHGCPEHLRPARANGAFWRDKIATNRARDAETNRILSEEGWDVLRFWEHEAPDTAADRVVDLVREKTEDARHRDSPTHS
ncbi:very short patch repair endonuclease [Nocardiopsis sp. NPDC058789]|uniref:very short patch repair endonuclease n=1 Tax=Nocardiopsis sp. NPDC058789 TaxID=3346634 RepID=UPI00366DD337